MNTVAKLTKKYYAICDFYSLEELRDRFLEQNLNLWERKKLYQGKDKLFAKLEKVFCQLVKARNKIAKPKKYENYFDFIANWDSIPKKELDNFFSKSKKLIKQINVQLPFKRLPNWYWSEYNIPNASLLYKFPSIPIPDKVLDVLEIKFSKLKNIKRRIEFKQRKQRYNLALPNLKKQTVTIYYDKTDTTPLGAVNLAHEIGHALAFLKLMDEKKDPESKSNYWYEKQAILSELAFEETLPENVRNIIRDRILYHFVLTFFEHSIYINPNQDFGKAFAQANGICYPTRQKENSLYLLNTFLIEKPCYSTIYSVLYIKLLAD